ncbi:MAG: hypothetical protein H7A23_14615 [Leptospiraceae bacterium]|nr:hypothetical protein [Leptospiraceae bacterium]MCP5495785.1 hypothetical protein [Leptospiraceae bacterium]
MKSITIHNLDDSLYLLIREKSKKQGISLNKTIQILLKQALGLDSKPSYNNGDYFLDLFGVWSPKDAEDFQKGIQEFSEINELDWK